MTVDQEKLSQVIKFFPEGMPIGAIRQLIVRLPDGLPLEQIMTQMGTIAQKLPLNDLPENEIVRQIVWTLQEHEKNATKDLPSNPKKIVRDYYDSLWLEMRLIGATVPKLQKEIFGHTFDAPLMTAALSHLGVDRDGKSRMVAYALAAKEMNLLNWIGMCENDEFDAVMDTGAKTVRIVKPYADEKKIVHQLKHAQESGAVAVGMDIDHTFNNRGEIDVVFGEPMEPKNLSQLASYRNATALPFVIKGVLSVSDAKKCVDLGANALVVSHHGGRLKYAVPPAMLLQDIRNAVGPKVQVFSDCGISSGMDAYKALALGADAVSVGSHMVKPLRGEGTAGVVREFRKMEMELKEAMANTGVSDCSRFDPTVIHTKTY